MKVIAMLETIRQAVPFLETHPDIELIFSDVQFADGLSFEVFRQVDTRCPIIFTTAYDHYAIEAFKTNGIDYLLKPVEENRLKQAIDKSKMFSPGMLLDKLLDMQHHVTDKVFKTRLW